MFSKKKNRKDNLAIVYDTNEMKHSNASVVAVERFYLADYNPWAFPLIYKLVQKILTLWLAGRLKKMTLPWFDWKSRWGIACKVAEMRTLWQSCHQRTLNRKVKTYQMLSPITKWHWLLIVLSRRQRLYREWLGAHGGQRRLPSGSHDGSQREHNGAGCLPNTHQEI